MEAGRRLCVAAAEMALRGRHLAWPGRENLVDGSGHGCRALVAPPCHADTRPPTTGGG